MSNRITDPRLLSDFDPALYPQCDEVAAPSPYEVGVSALRKLEFLAAYYEINRRHQALLSVRASKGGPVEERSALQAIERALLARDGLEDKYTPLGVAATPVFEKGFVKSVNFVQPAPPPAASSLSMLFAVQAPPPAHP